jgi:two-component system, response regulator PdtaR
MGDGLRILVADDDPAVRTFLWLTLTALGHTVMVVDGGRPLVERCRDWPFDLVVSDVRMPDLDGLTAAALIRYERDVPIVLASGSWTPGQLGRAAALGAHCVEKPFQPLTLVMALAAATRPARAATA